MATFVGKNRADILRQALTKLEQQTPVKAVGPGSIARSFAEAITTELGDFYSALDFQVAQSVISTATGRSLDLIGELYNTKRRTVTELAQIDKKLGAFYFYIDTPHNAPITIPIGTAVFTRADDFVGRQLSYLTTETATIPIGRTKVFTSIKPAFTDSVYTAGIDTLVVHNFQSPAGKIVRCTNPKPIAPQEGFEDDEAYRLRITKSVRVASSGTAEALRFAALAVFGVRDVKVISTPYGLGSVQLVVTPEDNSIAFQVRRNVLDTVDTVRPIGVRLFATLPTTIAVDVSATLIFRSPDIPGTDLGIRRGRVAVIRYLNTLLPGDTLVYNKMIQSILDTSDDIQDVLITRYAPNGVETLRRNYTPKEDEQVIPGRVEISVA